MSNTTSSSTGRQSHIVAAMLAVNQSAFHLKSIRSPKCVSVSPAKTVTKAAIIAGVVLFTATAAAAGGVLPHAAQSAISRAVEHIGIHVENPDKSASHTEDSTSTSSTIDDKSVTSSSVDDNSSTSSSSRRQPERLERRCGWPRRQRLSPRRPVPFVPRAPEQPQQGRRFRRNEEPHCRSRQGRADR